eukprot:TCONS_00009136-protein
MANHDSLDYDQVHRDDFDIDDGGNDELDDEKLQNLILDKAPPPERWYHGRLGRKGAEEFLLKNNTPCAYLVRESDRKPGMYSLSYLSSTKNLSHFRITAICGDFYIGGRKFQSLQHLIGYYSTYGNLVKNEKLQSPVASLEPVHLAYRVVAKFPFTGSTDTDELSFVAGDVFAVQNEIDDDWMWVVSQNDNKSGLVPKALTEALGPDADPFEGQSWFVAVDKHDAETILMNYGEVGNFIIRPSQNQGDYSLCLRERTQTLRFLIKRTGQQFSLGGRSFNSIEDIISRYKKEQLAEGVSLSRPLERVRYEPFLRNAQGSMRTREQHNGGLPRIPPPRLNSRLSDTGFVTKSGFLIKKGNRNKWKRLYMVLKGDEQQLLYFENEKRAKPKGLFDLSYASVYTVHDSLFGRPNCFQIVVRALNETQTHFLCTETSDQAQEWLEAIGPFCGSMNKQNQRKISQQNAIKELRSLEITICHAQKIPVNKLPHPYCVVSLNDIKTCRTQAKEAPEPVFDEEFKFEDLPNDITSFTVSMYTRKTGPYTKDKEMARVTVNLNTMEPGKALDNWHSLTSAQHKSDMGSVRITAKFKHEIIMPVEEYSKLTEVLLSRDYAFVQSLGEVSKDLNSLAFTLLKIFRQSSQDEHEEIQLIKTITSRELNNREKKETLFRGNTLATKLMDQYMKMVAIPYLQKTIKSVILKIMESRQNCELNPSRIEKGSNVAENLQQLIKFLEEITSNVFNSKQDCPKHLRYLFYCLQTEAKSVWPDEPEIPSRVVSAFLFLRLIVPAVLNPKMHNLVGESPSPMASRTLTLVAMCLQKLANLVEFGAKEPYLVVVNPFLKKYRSKMIDFLDDISNYSHPPSKMTEQNINKPDNTSRDLARDLASIHETCIKHDPQLQKLSSNQAHVKILLAIVEGVKQRKEQYISQSTQCDEFSI